jgi:hypothetical protein
MTITVQAASPAFWAGTLGSSSPFGRAVPVTVAAGTDRLLVVCIGGQSSMSKFITMTYGGVAMTPASVQELSPANSANGIWYLVNPPVGVANVYAGVTHWYAATCTISAVVFDGVNQASPIAAVAAPHSSTNTPSPISVALSAAAGGASIAAVTIGGGTNPGMTAAGQTFIGAAEKWNSLWSQASYELGASSDIGMTWTSGIQQTSQVAVALSPSAAESPTTITCTVGEASATGVQCVIGTGSPPTITCTVGTALATGIMAFVSNGSQFVSDPIANNTGSLLLNTVCNYTWFPSGRLGSLAGITPIEGVATTHPTDGRLRIALDAGPGVLLVAYRVSSALDDEVFYQAGASS